MSPLTYLDEAREVIEREYACASVPVASPTFEECSSENCQRPVYADGLCKLHRDVAWYRNFPVERGTPARRPSKAERLRSSASSMPKAPTNAEIAELRREALKRRFGS